MTEKPTPYCGQVTLVARQPDGFAVKKYRHFIFAVIAVLMVLTGVGWWQREAIIGAYRVHCRKTVTISLPNYQRVEVFHLSGETDGDVNDGFPLRPYNAYSKIIGRKVLVGKDAEAIATLWRSQSFDRHFQALCHEPAYALRFYQGSSVKFETSICYGCSNFYYTALGESNWWGFDTSTIAAANLLRRFQEIFPDSVPKQ
jgi:hypothetical protein